MSELNPADRIADLEDRLIEVKGQELSKHRQWVQVRRHLIFAGQWSRLARIDNPDESLKKVNAILKRALGELDKANADKCQP